MPATPCRNRSPTPAPGWSRPRVAAKIRETLGLLGIPENSVVQIRLARWSHAMPIAVPGFIADGMPEELLRPFQERIDFANQDDWALPAIENSLADAAEAAHAIRRRL